MVSEINGRNLLSLNDLTLSLGQDGRDIVRKVSFDVTPGQMVGVVGESGSGKTQVARAVLGLTPHPIVKTGGEITFRGAPLPDPSSAAIRKLRGAEIGMVFQEPMTSLNPSMKIGEQLHEGLALHRRDLNREGRHRLILAMLDRVGILNPEAAVRAWPHEFSGGMRQRMMLAAVMLLKPSLLVADEPTTALDAVVQRDVLELMVELTTENNTAVLLISHDLAMVARYTEKLVVMHQGLVVEQGDTADILDRPEHDYTRDLLAAMPRREPARPVARGNPIAEVRSLDVLYPGRTRLFGKVKPNQALAGIDLQVYPGEVVSVVGGSGSGKTTLGRVMAGLLRPSQGSVEFRGKPIGNPGADRREYRLNCQMVFQDPYSSLNPRMSISDLVGEGLRHVDNMSPTQKRERVQELLNDVGLGAGYTERFPHELSGGQRQRVAIARALVRKPDFVIADEPVSALDVTVRAQVLRLFADLQKKNGFSCLFISHDLSVVEQVSDRVVVMQHGRIIEQGTRDEIFDAPQEPYTRRLLSAIPLLATNTYGGVSLKWRFNNA